MTSIPHLEQVKKALHMQGMQWEDLRRTCDQIVLFGSWAISAQRQHSDLDLFCVGFGRRLKTDRLDLVWCTPEFVLSSKWLGSELASHIATFGIWMHGRDNWTSNARISQDAIEFKRHLIRSRLAAMQKTWQHLALDYRVKHVVKLRRDLQRLVTMKARRPIPATPILDNEWAITGSSYETLSKHLSQSGEPELIDASQLAMIRDLLPVLDWRDECSLLSGYGQR